MRLVKNNNAPSISIKDIDMENWQIVAKLSKDMDMTNVKFLRNRDGKMSYLETKDGRFEFSGGVNRYLYTGSVYDTEKKILFYDEKSDVVWWLDLTNGKVTIWSSYKDDYTLGVDFKWWSANVNILKKDRTNYRFTLPWRDLKTEPAILGWNFEKRALDNKIYGTYDKWWCILDKQTNQCAMFLSPKWDIFVPESYQDKFIWSYEYDDIDVEVEIVLYKWWILYGSALKDESNRVMMYRIRSVIVDE